jgi:hypothetical protein
MASLANAQVWSLHSGATGRVEYNDNYFFVPVDTQSAFTASITPFLTAARRTETSDVTALVAVGANKVWGLSPSVDPYLSGRLALVGSLREARSTWTGNASFVRSANLQNEAGQTGAPLVLAFTDAASVTGEYAFALTERWSLGATVGVYSNRYEAIKSDSPLSNNHGYYASGNVEYAYSDRTQFTFVTGYTYDDSSVARTSGVTATVGAVHQFSPQLTVSASAGIFWSDTEPRATALAGGTTAATRGTVSAGVISYAVIRAHAGWRQPVGRPDAQQLRHAQQDRFCFRFVDAPVLGRLHRSLGPATRGPLSRQRSRAQPPTQYSGEIGVSYLLRRALAARCRLRYTGARYEQKRGEPKSNLVFVSIAYNWPGASFTDWVGRRSDAQGLPGAGAVSLPVSSPESASMPGVPGSPFDQLPIP